MRWTVHGVDGGSLMSHLKRIYKRNEKKIRTMFSLSLLTIRIRQRTRKNYNYKA